MKFVIVTVPLRATPELMPPYGALSITTALRKAGHEADFYNLDFFRPTFEEILEYLAKRKPDCLGISAVVSTGYRFVQDLTRLVKNRFPSMTILLGGNLGASARLLLRNTGVDYVCAGEGERVVLTFASFLQGTISLEDLKQVPGFALMDGDNFIFTGYAPNTPAAEIFEIDWDLLGDATSHYFPEGLLVGLSSPDAKVYDLPITEKKPRTIVLPASKGCVSRCTFCHRWIKGIRIVPIEILAARIDALIRDYNIGIIAFADECFGVDHAWVRHLCQLMKERNIRWWVTGMRVSRLTPELVAQMRESGCYNITFGIESGSQTILDVMEKRSTIKENQDAMRYATHEGLPSVIQLVLGMPGETPETVKETERFIRKVVSQSEHINPMDVSLNFAQALPGTPLYEFAMKKGIIEERGGEERYLLEISDRNARDFETTLNFTDFPMVYLLKWHFQLTTAAREKYYTQWGQQRYIRKLLETRSLNLKEPQKLNSFSLFMANPSLKKIPLFFPRLAGLLTRSIWQLLVFPLLLKDTNVRHFLRLFWEYVTFKCGKKPQNIDYPPAKSLRKFLAEDFTMPEGSDASDFKLRQGQ